MKYWICCRLSLSNPLTSAGMSLTLDLSPCEKLYMFWTTLVTRSKLTLADWLLSLSCLLAEASLSLSRSSSMLPTSLPRDATLVWHLSNSCSRPSIIPVTCMSSSRSLSLSLLSKKRGLRTTLNWCESSVLGEYNDGSYTSEDSPSKYANGDHGVGCHQSANQSWPQHWASNRRGDVAILLVLHILHLYLMNLLRNVS